MAKTALFSRLRFLARRARHGTSRASHDAALLTRRAFVERTLLALGAASAGCYGTDDEGPNGPLDAGAEGDSGAAGDAGAEGARVAIIGAGMAGLMCARVLEAAGVKATLYEASKDVGGRMKTAREGFADGQVAELGGEFIDTGHMTMRMLAEELELVLDDRSEALDATTRADVWWVEGAAVPEATIVTQFEQVAPKWYGLLEAADDEEDDSVYVQLDNTSLADFLDTELAELPELKSVLANGYRGEYGRELDEQSALNLIYLIGSDDPDPFRMFGVSDERFHTHTGNDTFPTRVAEALESEIKREWRLDKAAKTGTAYTLTFAGPDGSEQVEVDQVVFALPFTLLRKVDLAGLALSADKRAVIEALGYGTNAKLMGSFTRRVWRVDHDALGGVTSDEPFQQCWDTSIGQAGESGLLTNFLGGEQGVKSGEGEPEAWYTSVLVAGAEQVFPGVEAAYVAGSAVRMHWPSAPFQLGSYACYAPGQWTYYGTEGLPEGDGTLHFCGEHTSLDFQGYMEGAAETGALAAGAVLEKLGKQASEKHRALLALKRAVPQPFYGEQAHIRQRGERLRAQLQAMVELSARMEKA